MTHPAPQSQPATATPDTSSAPTGSPGERVIWQLGGKDVLSFLQGLVSNDVLKLEKAPGIVWAALLTPQGKYLADFFVVRRQDAAPQDILIDIATPLAADTLKRLTMYRLRADVQIAPATFGVSRGITAPPEGALPDPRHPALGWRHYGTAPEAPRDQIDWDALRVELEVPEYPNELIPNETFILEAGFERLHGVDFRKGCYVGQEVTARMKHKTELRKGLTRVAINGWAPPGTPILLEDGREAGVLGTVSGNHALAHMRFDRMSAQLLAAEARISAIEAAAPPNALPES